MKGRNVDIFIYHACWILTHPEATIKSMEDNEVDILSIEKDLNKLGDKTINKLIGVYKHVNILLPLYTGISDWIVFDLEMENTDPVFCGETLEWRTKTIKRIEKNKN